MPRSDDYKAAIALAVADLRRVLQAPGEPDRRPALCRGGLRGPHPALLWPGKARTWPEVRVSPEDGAGEIPLTEQILILHYLFNASGEPLAGRTIDFRQVPEGGFYWSAFVSRAQKPLLATFGHDLGLYAKVVATLGGEPVPLGDAVARFLAFPRVPVTHVLWRGDEEFPPEANILFDETIPGIFAHRGHRRPGRRLGLPLDGGGPKFRQSPDGRPGPG